MSDDFDLRLRRELRALADAVPTASAIRPMPAPDGHSARVDRDQPSLTRVRAGRGLSVWWSATAVGLVLIVVAAAAILSSGHSAKPGASGVQATGNDNSTPGTLTGLGILQAQVVASFGDGPTAAVLGPDRAAYVVAASVTWRVDLQTGDKMAITQYGQQPVPGQGTIGRPRLLATGGKDVLILDDKNQLWRWQPAEGDRTGRGTLSRVDIPDAVTWGLGISAIGTAAVNPAFDQYYLFVADPTARQIYEYPPNSEGSSYPSAGRMGYLSVAQDLSKVDDAYIDGDVYLASGGRIIKYVLGQPHTDWVADPGGSAPFYGRLTADSASPDEGTLYAYDRYNYRVVAFSKADGSLVGQYYAPPTEERTTRWFVHLDGMFVLPATASNGPRLYWLEDGNLMSARLPATGPLPTATPTPAGPTTASPAAPSGAAPSRTPTVLRPEIAMTTSGEGPATLLTDGRVLVLDGTDARAELYYPGAQDFRSTGSMSIARAAETATRLRDGRVLIAGGEDDSTGQTVVFASAEIYDPATGTFSPTGSMETARFGQTATLLQDGRVLIAGGSHDGTGSLSSAEVYDPATGSFSASGSLLEPLFGDTATLLASGKVLITGGVGGGSADRTAELYDPETGMFSLTGTMLDSAANETATLLADGRVLIAGGGDEGHPITAGAQLYDPETGSFSRTGSMSTARMVFTATLLPDDTVLVAGGSDGSGALTSTEAYDPRTGQFTGSVALVLRRAGHNATLLPNGQVLITGGGHPTAEVLGPSVGG
jgi:hypothetical protein